MLFVNALVMILLFSMMPRFIISIREVYDHDLDCHWQGIDSGFGVLSQPTASQDMSVSVIAFAPDVTFERPDSEIDEVDIGDSKMTLSSEAPVVEDGVHQV